MFSWLKNKDFSNKKNLEKLYDSIYALRIKRGISWSNNDLVQIENLYDYINNLNVPDDKEIKVLYKDILSELSFFRIKVKSISSSSKEKLDISKTDIDILFSSPYYNLSVFSLIKVLTLQLTYYPNSIDSRIVDRLRQKVQKKDKIPENWNSQIMDFLSQIKANNENIKDDGTKSLLNHIARYLSDYILNFKVEQLLNSNFRVSDFECFFDGIDSIVFNDLKHLKLINKINFILENTNIDDKNKEELRIKLEYIKSKLSNNSSNLEEIELGIRNGDIILSNDFDDYQFNYIEPTSCDDDMILTINNSISLDLNIAFKVKEQGDIYTLDTFITDVPSFLMQNDPLFWEAYKRSTSMYLQFEKGQLPINMLPVEISNNLFSLREGTSHQAIDFTFKIGKNGQIYDTSVSLKNINISKNITPTEVLNILRVHGNFTPYSKDLKLYDTICKTVINNTNNKFLKSLNGKVDYFVKFPSILVNLFVANEDCLSIYLDGNRYSKHASKVPYAHSVAPLRRFCDDINLAFLLEHLNISSYDEKKIHFIEDNLDEIIAHLNYRKNVANFVQSRPYFSRKYIRKQKRNL